MINRITVPTTAALRKHAKRLGYHAILMSWKRIGFALAIVCSSLLHNATDAAMIVNIEEVGSDVVASYTGSIDLTGIGFNSLGSANTNRIVATVGQVNWQNGVATKASLTDFGKNPWTVAPSAFGTGGVFSPDSLSIAAGNAFGFQSNGFYIEPSYVSGSPISGSMTFENQTLASMGINAGDGIMNATFSSGDTLTVNAVPEPTSIAFLATGGLAVGGLAVARRRRGTGADS